MSYSLTSAYCPSIVTRLSTRYTNVSSIVVIRLPMTQLSHVKLKWRKKHKSWCLCFIHGIYLKDIRCMYALHFSEEENVKMFVGDIAKNMNAPCNKKTCKH